MHGYGLEQSLPDLHGGLHHPHHPSPMMQHPLTPYSPMDESITSLSPPSVSSCPPLTSLSLPVSVMSAGDRLSSHHQLHQQYYQTPPITSTPTHHIIMNYPGTPELCNSSSDWQQSPSHTSQSSTISAILSTLLAPLRSSLSDTSTLLQWHLTWPTLTHSLPSYSHLQFHHYHLIHVFNDHYHLKFSFDLSSPLPIPVNVPSIPSEE